MKGPFVMFTVLGMLVGSGGTATAEGRPQRKGRTVQRYYDAPWLPWAGNCPLSNGTDCVSIETRGSEAFLTAKATDAHGQPVWVAVWGYDTLYGTFCGETTEAISVDPRVELRFSVGAYFGPDYTGLARCLPGIATTGTIAVALYSSPPAHAVPREPSRRTTSPSPTVSTDHSAEKVERSVRLPLRRHLRSEALPPS